MFNNFLTNFKEEHHVPGGYRFLGPGTKLQERLECGDEPLNPLDTFARDHSLAYARSNQLADRHIANRILEQKAWGHVTSKDAGLGERATALLTATAMKVKRTVGMGLKQR